MMIALCVVFLAVIAAWMVAELMLFRSVARICRTSELSRRVKKWTVVMAVADIPLACMSLYDWFLSSVNFPFRTPNGYCFHIWNCPDSALIDSIASVALSLVTAPIYGLFFGVYNLLHCLLIPVVFVEKLPDDGFDIFAGTVAFALACSSLVLSSVYLLGGAFLRGKIMWHASNRSKWRTVFVFLATYWPHMLLCKFMGLAIIAANNGGCCDWLD